MPVLSVDGADIFYELVGEGRPAFVLVHGGMCDHRDWEALVARLSAGQAVLTMDLRAHGRSNGEAATCSVPRWAADINSLIDTLGLAPAVLVGHSLASRIVAEAAWARPESAAGLVLLDGSRSYGGHAATTPSEEAAGPAASLAAILDTTIGPYVEVSSKARLLETMSAAPVEVMAACVEAIRDWDMARADIVFPGLPPALPVLAIQSTYHDQFTARRSLATARDRTPYLDFLSHAVGRLEIRVLPHTGHFSMIEHPDEVAALLLDFAQAALKTTTRQVRNEHDESARRR